MALLDDLTQRLTTLLKQEPDLPEFLEAASQRMMERGVLESPVTAKTPELAARALIRDNPILKELRPTVDAQAAQSMETAEELITGLLPTPER